MKKIGEIFHEVAFFETRVSSQSIDKRKYRMVESIEKKLSIWKNYHCGVGYCQGCCVAQKRAEIPIIALQN